MKKYTPFCENGVLFYHYFYYILCLYLFSALSSTEKKAYRITSGRDFYLAAISHHSHLGYLTATSRNQHTFP